MKKCPTRTGDTEAVSVCGRDATTHAFHNGGWGSFATLCDIDGEGDEAKEDSSCDGGDGDDDDDDDS